MEEIIMANFDLTGKVALVTGGSYGIGFAIACGLAEAGATIVFNDLRQDLVDKGLAAYAEKGIKAYGYVCNVCDEEGVTATADQWIMDQADKSLRNILAIEHEFERLGATIDEATMQGYEATAKEYWDYGPYYSMYGEQYISPYKDIFEPLGVSYESFEYFYVTSAKQEVVFDTLYAQGGEKGVSTEDLTSYFEDNYTSYTYFNQSLY
jgi:hypothetical protein